MEPESAPTGPAPAPEPARLWTRDFALYALALAGGALGDALLIVALPYLVLEATGDPKAIALVLLLGSLPRFAGPLIGVLADRWPLRLPLAAAGGLRGLLVGGLGSLALGGGLEPALIYVAAVLNGAVSAYAFAAGSVAVPTLVPRGALARANGVIQGALMGVPLVGLGTAGGLVAAFGPARTVLIAAPAFMLLGLLMALVRFPARDATRSEAGSRALLADLAAGGRFLLGAGALGLVFPLSVLLNAVLMLLNALMPVVMERAGRGAAGYGLFETAVSLGILAGIALVGALGSRLAPPRAVSVAQAAMAVGFGVMAVGGFAAHLGGGAVMGFGLGFTEVAAITMLQLAAPRDVLGKVTGAIFTANALGQALGAAVAAPLAEGAPAEAVFLGCSAVVALGTVVWFTAQHRDRERLTAMMAGAGD